MKNVFLCFCLTVFLICPVFATEVPWDSVCRISSATGTGSGVCFMEAEGFSYALTNAHVLTPENSTVADAAPTIEYWNNGHASGEVDAELVSSHIGYDVAIVRVDTSEWPVRPTCIPLVADVEENNAITVLGCANGDWPTAYQGRRLQGNIGGRIPFTPPPAGGRSGGPLLTGDGYGIVGLVSYQISDLDQQTGQERNVRGLAVPSHIIISILNAGKSTIRWSLRQCGPEGCPQPNYGAGLNGNIGPFSGGIGAGLGGNNYAPQYGSQQQPPARQFGIGNEITYAPPAPIYPTLPQPSTLPVPTEQNGSAYDVSVLEQRFGQCEQIQRATAQDIAALYDRTDDAHARLVTIEDNLGIVAGSSADAADAAAEANTNAQKAADAAQDAQDATGVIPDLINDATETAKSGAITAVKTWLMGLASTFGPWGVGLTGLVLFLAYRKFKPILDAMDGLKDGRISPKGYLKQIQYLIDKRDGVIEGNYPQGWDPWGPALPPNPFPQQPQQQPPQTPPTA